MAGKSNQVRWIVAVAAILFIGVLIRSSLHQTQLKYEVCVNFKGGSHCATATGSTLEEAVRGAHDIDCEFLAQGRDEIMVCSDTESSSVRQIQ
ncbi:MAG: hypothetical protein WA002_09600 [Candidatus Acidiferrales bacterium]